MFDYRQKIKDSGLKCVWIAEQLGVSKSLFSMFLAQQRNLQPDKMRKLHMILNMRSGNEQG